MRYSQLSENPLDMERLPGESMGDFIKRIELAKGTEPVELGGVDPEIADWPYWNTRDGEVLGYNYPGHKLGDQDQVARLQNFLKAQGYDIAVDGVLGNQTAAAINQYLSKTREPIDAVDIEKEYPDPETGVFPDELEYEPELPADTSTLSAVERMRRDIEISKQAAIDAAKDERAQAFRQDLRRQVK